MTFETIERPRSAPLPEGLFKDTLQQLSPAPIERVLPSGVVLEEHGTVPEFLHILLAGSVQMYGSLSTRISTVDLIEAPDAIGLAAVVSNQMALASYITLTRCRILSVNANSARSALNDDHEFATAVARHLAHQTRRRVRAVHNQKLRTGIERLANWVLATWIASGRNETFKRPVKKLVLASLLGLTPESLSRCSAQLMSHGASLEGSEIKVFDVDLLARLAGPNMLLDEHALAAE